MVTRCGGLYGGGVGERVHFTGGRRRGTTTTMRIVVSAGEVSGDQHLARVLKAIRSMQPDAAVRGMAGAACAEAGAVLDVDCYRAGAGMGFFELFRSGNKVLSSFKTLCSVIDSWKPDLLILVDYPDFNLRLAKFAKKRGVKVLYYIPPKVWAWRSGRVRKIRRYVDQVAAIFPFEPGFYAQHGYARVRYVGHPLSERVASFSAPATREDTVLFLPGSRKFEVERLLVPMLQAYEILHKRYSTLRPVVVLAPNIESEWVKSLIGNRVPAEILDRVEWSQDDALKAMYRARVGVLKSGTCNLEGAIAGLPFVSVYSGTLLAKVIVLTLVALKEYSPVNIIRAHTVKEVMQTVLSPNEVAHEVEQLLVEGAARKELVQGLAEVSRALCEPEQRAPVEWRSLSVSERVARCAFDLVEQKPAAAVSENL